MCPNAGRKSMQRGTALAYNQHTGRDFLNIAPLDEVEQPQHGRRRFTVG